MRYTVDPLPAGAAARGAGLVSDCSTARSSFCSVIGFSRNAEAPNLVASTAVSMVPWPLIMITGIVSRPEAPHSLSSVMPSTSGIQMSSSTRSGRMRSRTARAWAAFSASSTVWPSSDRMSDNRPRMPSSSSTTRIVAIELSVHLGCRSACVLGCLRSRGG